MAKVPNHYRKWGGGGETKQKAAFIRKTCILEGWDFFFFIIIHWAMQIYCLLSEELFNQLNPSQSGLLALPRHVANTENMQVCKC